MEQTYRGITWRNQRELSEKLHKRESYVNYYMRKYGMTCEEIIDYVLDGKYRRTHTTNDPGSYRGIHWYSDQDLSRKLGKNDSYVYYHRNVRKLSYEQIIDAVLNDAETREKPIIAEKREGMKNNISKNNNKATRLTNPGNYRGITWTSYSELSQKLGHARGYVATMMKKYNITCEEIIDHHFEKIVKQSNPKIVARFEKVSFEEFRKSWIDARYYEGDGYLKAIYDSIKIPQRSTKRSSGYDFSYPGLTPLLLERGKSYLIPTGIRCVFFKDGYDLSIYPRSSVGFKYRGHLDNTVGIIDNDYFEADNEGHIKIKLSCDPRGEKDYFIINPGDKFCQGIIREFFLADGDDEVEKKDRVGGMGSTGK